MVNEESVMTLFKKDSKGKIRVWNGWVVGSEVVTHTGLSGGKMKEERRRAKPKNVGKANETTGHEQAKLELVSKANKERDKGYFNTVKEAENSLVILPMLAHPYDKRKKHISFPAYAQPKLDGVRCMVKLSKDRITMFTRKGKPFPFMGKLLSDLQQFADKMDERDEPEVYLDGELYSDEIPFEELVGHCRRSFESHEKKGTTASLELVKLNVFDAYFPHDPKMDFLKRYDWVTGRLIGVEERPYEMISLVDLYGVKDEAEMLVAHAKFISQGHEGTIIRNSKGAYKLNARSNDLLKFKEFLDGEFEIISFRSAEGRDEGTVIWTCETKEGKAFDCRPRGTHAQRTEWYDNGNNYVGKLLTVRYQEFTGDGLPRFPVGITIRDYE